jgi:hypothetical protein
MIKNSTLFFRVKQKTNKNTENNEINGFNDVQQYLNSHRVEPRKSVVDSILSFSKSYRTAKLEGDNDKYVDLFIN